MDKPEKFQKPDDEALQARLTSEQYRVTQRHGTEPPFRNEYWDHNQPGIYVDIVSGEPLFSSIDKLRSSCGWPTFSRPLEGENIIVGKDQRYWMTRNEVRSRVADSHLGHVFPKVGSVTEAKYCINSASLRFIPTERLVNEGYSSYLSLFSAVPERSS